jgi:hypothetical protein
MEFPPGVPHGIIGQLTKDCGGNVHDRGVVTVKTAPDYMTHPWWCEKNIVDLKTNSKLWSVSESVWEPIAEHADDKDRCPWICWTFTERFQFTHYSIASSNQPVGGHHPRNWVIEAWGDDNKWYVVDRRRGVAFLNEPNRICSFAIRSAKIWNCTRVRLTHFGRNHAGTDCLCIGAFEVFDVPVHD